MLFNRPGEHRHYGCMKAWFAIASGGILMVVALATACSSDDGACDPNAQSGCDGPLVCEVVEDGSSGCFAPVVVRGQVYSLADEGAVAGARVVALDANGAPAGIAAWR
jgi:hypothetical protein